MKTCSKCGYSFVKDDATVCANCGARFVNPPASAAPSTSSTVLMPDEYENGAHHSVGSMDSALFSDPGAKIKKVTQIVFWISCIACFVLAITLFGHAAEEDGGLYALWGFVTLLAGPLVSWISSLLLYAFGELVENSGRHC